MVKTQAFTLPLDMTTFPCVLMAENLQIKTMNPAMIKFLNLSRRDDLNERLLMNYISEEDQNTIFDLLSSKEKPDTDQRWEVITFTSTDGSKRNILLNISNTLQLSKNADAYFLVGIPLSNVDSESISVDPTNLSIPKIFLSNKYKSIFENAPFGIMILDQLGNVEESNPTFDKHFGISRKLQTKWHYADLLGNDHKKQFEDLLEILERKHPNHVKDIFKMKVKDNEHMILEVSVSKINIDHDSKNKLMMISEDVTNQKDTHAALLQSEKLALTGRLAASLAHEINNPLQTAIGCLGLAEEMLGEDNRDLSVYINMAMEELQRSARIVKKLRDLNRKVDSYDKTPIDIQKILDDILILTKNPLYDKKIVPFFTYEGPPPIVMASKDQIQQVVLNLMMNAIDALPDGGHIYLAIVHTADPKGVKVTIRDTGIGMDPEVMNNLFNPFFTTKKDGLGLGLYICKNIIEDHGGWLEVESEPGQGTEFSIWLLGLNPAEEKE